MTEHTAINPGHAPQTPLLDRETKHSRERVQLAPYAFCSEDSRGRQFPEAADPLRTVFERDRDRIVHCTGFRRLMYKTQVFVNSEGDHNRTRLSHSIEVSQVARSVGSALSLNEPLCEALALAHDIGHPPFGHRGERALATLMEKHGGFRHNAQVLRVVDRLERRSPAYPGLNLTREVRESLLKHEGNEDWPNEFLPRPRHPLIEAQVVDLADSTAYHKHDLEDGLLAHMFSEDELTQEVSIWRDARRRVAERHSGFLEDSHDFKLRVERIANEVIKITIQDLIEHSNGRLIEAAPDSPEAVRELDRFVIAHGPEMSAKVAELNSFLYRRFYRHDHLKRFLTYATRILEDLFGAFTAQPEQLAPWYQRWADEVGLERSICDYLAGMTDRFAKSEHERLAGR